MTKDVVTKFIHDLKSTKPASPENQVRVHKFDVANRNVILPYSRRDYYKIWITLGNGKIHYATRSVEITQPALIFSNPRVLILMKALDEVSKLAAEYPGWMLERAGKDRVIE